MNSENLEIGNLAVVEYRSKVITSPVHNWIEQHKIPYAESCARQILYGHDTDFVEFPLANALDEQGNSVATVMHGADGYSCLLDLVCGLKSAKFAETHIRHQFFDRWKKYAERDPWNANRYKTFIAQLKADSNLVTDKIIAQYQAPKIEHAARDLSGQKVGDRLLIVGALNLNRRLSQSTLNLLRVFESKQKGCKDFISITHPDETVLQIIEKDIKHFESEKTLHSGIVFRSFTDLAMNCETHDRIYVDLPMGENPEADNELIASWQGRCRQDNVLTHMKGPYSHSAQSTDTWKDAMLEQYFSPEDLHQNLLVREKNTAIVVEKAKELTGMCAQLRMHGLIPSQVFATGELSSAVTIRP